MNAVSRRSAFVVTAVVGSLWLLGTNPGIGYAQLRPNSPGSDAAPTPNLFRLLDLIEYQFGSKSDRSFKITGADAFSLYSVIPKDDKLSLSAEIPNKHGRPEFRGFVFHLGGGPVTNGYVWTPRTETIGTIDLSAEQEISSASGFSFEELGKHPNVIRVGNGLAINLFGAIMEDRSVVKAGSRQSYVNKDGRKLYGRVISQTTQAGRTTVKETILR